MRAKYSGKEVCIKCKLKPELRGPNMRETQDHLEICQGYSEVRVSRDTANFADTFSNFANLIKEREKMFINILKVREKKQK